jgi:hypothetical protein
MTTGLLDLESSAARTTAPPRLRRLDIALSPLKLGKFGGRTSPNRLGPPSSIATYFEDTLETEPTAYLPSRLLMMQATEKARNDRADQRRTTDSASTLDLIRRLIQRLVYARHGRDCMGCESPVRDWEPEGDQQTK